MSFVASSSEFTFAVALANQAVSNRPTHPVLGNLMLIADKETQTVTVSGFDLSLGIRYVLKAEVEENIQTTLPSKLLTNILQKLPDEQIKLAEAGENLFTLTNSTGSYSLRGMSVDEFPELEVDAEFETSATLPASDFVDMVRRSLYAASTDETKQVLTSLHLAMGDWVEAAATDGHRLSRIRIDVDSEGENSVNIPGRACAELIKVIDKVKATELSLHFDNSFLVAKIGEQRVLTRLIEGQYPNYNQLIPQQFAWEMSADKQQMVTVLERVAIMADQANGLIVLDCKGDLLTIQVDAKDVGSGVEQITCKTEADMKAAFNVKYLVQAIKAIPGERVAIRGNSPTSPFVIQAPTNETTVGLVMPVQIRG